ncbi:hypothetical protein EON62_05220, partial [archaeon]
MQVWKAAGMDMTNVEFLWASDEINAHANEYWLRVMDVARRNNVSRVRASVTTCACARPPAVCTVQWCSSTRVPRPLLLLQITRCCTIMGRKETDEMSAAQIFYPCMQCADVFFLKADICQLGMDQRKVNMLAREYCDAAEPKIKFKPIVLSHRTSHPGPRARARTLHTVLGRTTRNAGPQLLLCTQCVPIHCSLYVGWSHDVRGFGRCCRHGHG